MSLRSWQDQVSHEEAEQAKTPDQRRIEEDAWKIPKETVRDEVECRLHVASVGVFCQKFAGAFSVCKGRRMDAAYKRAGIER